jgi:phosphoribosylformimino-5-aminoimidazole carboxamide ribotide isomerase
MLVIPAIDLRGGRVVRLVQGRADEQTTYGDDPAAQARAWVEQGAEFLHVVDLDGAFSGAGENGEAIREIVKAVDIPCEVGGGIRDAGAAGKLLSLGVDRVIFGTVAVKEPEVVARAVERFGPAHVVVGLDARDGNVSVEGWTEASDRSAVDLARQMKSLGVERIVYTDISRDGMSTGPNVAATAELATATGMKVIASGGVGALEHIRELTAHEAEGIEAVIVGKALYDGRLRLGDVLDAAKPRGDME